MTREDLFNELENRETEYGFNATDVSELINEFFDSNVCIPKGENRHPYAEVWHEAIENTNITIESLVDDKEWNFKYTGAVRIKPSEPVYEWQWLLKTIDGTFILSRYFTDDEHKASFEQGTKLEETKRERQ